MLSVIVKKILDENRFPFFFSFALCAPSRRNFVLGTAGTAEDRFIHAFVCERERTNEE